MELHIFAQYYKLFALLLANQNQVIFNVYDYLPLYLLLLLNCGLKKGDKQTLGAYCHVPLFVSDLFCI